MAHQSCISYLTGIIWDRSQVSRMQSDNFSPVRNSLKSEEVRSLLPTPQEEKNRFNSMASLFGYIMSYLKEESASKHQEGPPGPPSKWSFFTISLCKMTEKVRDRTEGRHHSYEAGIGFKM